tara:strand:+ start:35375 stop:36757 length:1383 start_codon:yes stop_codon:yes gene_type:complete
VTALPSVSVNSCPTIAAVATAPGVGGLSVIRISGPKAQSVGQKLSGSKKKNLKPRYAKYTPIVSPSGTNIDSGIITYFPLPNSYTGEDVIEVACHGGSVISSQVLEACFSFGCKPAEPGEFTKRAFLNGKMDLIQAEAVASLIMSSSSLSKEANYRILSGQFSKIINDLKFSLLDLVVTLEAELDFTEEEITPLSTNKKLSLLSDAVSGVDDLLATYHTGKMLERGALVVLVGKPNVGKSSLLNSILSEERTIVSDAPGTTRDAVEVPFLIKGFPVRFVDTAGMRDADSIVEQKGVKFSRKYIKKADLVINVFDAKDNNGESIEKDLFSPNPSYVRHLRVFNKVDLVTKRSDHKRNGETFFTSALTGDGIDPLLEAIYNNLVGTPLLSNQVIINSSRHHEALQRVSSCLGATKVGLKREDPLDVVASDLRISVSILDELLGVTTADDILENVFSKFCIGK